VTAEFGGGSLTAIVGANGVGKSTLLRVLLGLVTPRTGRVVLHGRDLGACSAVERARVMAYVPQRAEGGQGFSVREMVGMGRYALRGGDSHEAEVEGALARLSLVDRGSDAFGALSAGQQQRALLARALAQLGAGCGDAGLAGKVLLADEPVAAMDAGHGLATLGLLRSLADAGMCVVCVMHDLNLVLRMATRVVALGPREGGGGEGGGGGSVVVGQGVPSEVVTPEVMGPLFGAEFERVSGARGTALIATSPGARRIGGT
jgi:iron complex transport system ATP-binding protein